MFGLWANIRVPYISPYLCIFIQLNLLAAFDTKRASKCFVFCHNLFGRAAGGLANGKYTDGRRLQSHFWAKCDRNGPAGNTELQASKARTHIRTPCPANGCAITQLSTPGTQQAGFHLHGLAAFQMLAPHTHTQIQPCVLLLGLCLQVLNVCRMD